MTSTTPNTPKTLGAYLRYMRIGHYRNPPYTMGGFLRLREDFLHTELQALLPKLSADQLWKVIDGVATIRGSFSKPVYERLHRKHKNYITADNGWLSPDGRFYPCEYHQHSWLASMFWKNETETYTENELEQEGWVKCQRVSDDWLGFWHRGGEKGLFDSKRVPAATEIQAKLVRDRCLETKSQMPYWAEEFR